MTKKTQIIVGIALGAIAFACYSASLVFSGFSNEEPAYILIDNDDDIDSIRTKLSFIEPSEQLLGFNICSSLLSLHEKMHTGRYEISSSISKLQLVRNIRNHNEKPINLVIPSAVRTLDDLADKIASNLMISSQDLLKAMRESTLLANESYTEATLISLFIPNTYEVYWDTTPEALIKRMKHEHDTFWTQDRLASLTTVSNYIGNDFTIFDAYTLASIVDSETANNAEKSNIAGLYLNRIKIRMPLQSDPTVKFALKDFALKRILHKHLDTDSPYNTYRNEGLPPGPICVPTIAGIDAVLHFTPHNYIYMCAKEDFSGTHNFASNYNEHIRNAHKYAKALDARNIK